MNTVSEESFEKALDKIRELSKQRAKLLKILKSIVAEQDEYGFHGPTKGMRLAREAIQQTKEK